MSVPFTISVAGERISIEYWLVAKAIVIKLTDRPNMSSAVYCECYRKNQTNKAILGEKMYFDADFA